MVQILDLVEWPTQTIRDTLEKMLVSVVISE